MPVYRPQFKCSSRRERLLGLEIVRTISLEVEGPEVGLEGRTEHIVDSREDGRWISICKCVHTHTSASYAFKP